MNVIRMPSVAVEDTLVDMKALVKFGLHAVESSEPSEFAAMKNEFCTLFYLMIDKIEAAAKANERPVRKEA